MLDIAVLKSILVTWSLKIFGVLVFTFVLFKFSSWIRRRLQSAFLRSGMDQTVSGFLAKMIYYLLLASGLVSLLGIFGVQTASFAALLASLGFAVGMALQGTLGHFAAGILLLVLRPFRVDDVIQVSGNTGKVVFIDLFNTILNTPDNRKVVIPNGQVFGNPIEVMTAYATRRVDVTVGCSYDANIQETRATLEKVIQSITKKLPEPDSVVYLNSLGESSVDWAVRVWVKTEDYWTVREEMVAAIKTQLEQAKISIPYPHLELVMPQKSQ